MRFFTALFVVLSLALPTTANALFLTHKTGPAVAGLVGWYDPDDASTITSSSGVVSAWNDKSGFAHNAAPGIGPNTGIDSLNGKNLMQFTGTQYLVIPQNSDMNPAPGTGAQTIFIVEKPTAGATGILISKASVTAGTRTFYLAYSAATPGAGLLTYTGGTNHEWSTARVHSISRILEYTITPTAQNIKVNGVDFGNVSIGTGTVAADILIGARRNTGSNGGVTGKVTSASIGDILIFNRALTAAERETVGNYLSYKYDIPYQINGKLNFIFVGGSFENQGYGGANRAIFENRIDDTYNLQTNVVVQATNGYDSALTAAAIDGWLAPYPAGSYVILDTCVGADATATRPYSSLSAGQIQQFKDNVTYMFEAIKARNMTAIAGNASFRTWTVDTGGVVTPSTQSLGSLPYNTNIAEPIMHTYLDPQLFWGDGSPKLDFYKMFLNNYTTYIQADGVHPTNPAGTDAMQQFHLDTWIKLVRGRAITVTELP